MHECGFSIEIIYTYVYADIIYMQWSDLLIFFFVTSVLDQKKENRYEPSCHFEGFIWHLPFKRHSQTNMFVKKKETGGGSVFGAAGANLTPFNCIISTTFIDQDFDLYL